MNLLSIVLMVVIAVWVGGAIAYLVRHKGSSCGSCGGCAGCSGCAGASACANARKCNKGVQTSMVTKDKRRRSKVH